MTDDEVTRALVLISDYLSLREDAQLWMDLGMAEVASAAAKLASMMDDLYAEMDVEFWNLAAHYDDGWDILREAGDMHAEV